MSKVVYVNVDVVIRDAADRYLLITRGAGESHAPGQRSFVGGTVEVTTASGDVLEEVGVDLGDAPLHYVESTAFISDADEPVVNVLFATVVPSGVRAVADGVEVAAVAWLTAADVIGDPTVPTWTRAGLERAVSVLDH